MIRNMEGMKLSEGVGKYHFIILQLYRYHANCIADEVSRQPNVDNISPIDKKAPITMSRPGTAMCVLVCILLESIG